MLKENFDYIIKNDAVKFVASDKTDLERAYEIITGFDLASKCAVFLSPVFGRINPAEIVDFMKEKKLNNINFQLQLHKYIWSPDARGV
jgi:7-carboxy-7-deazaguanine synthase